MTDRLALSWAAFDLLASGEADAAGLRVLRDGQFSKHLLLLREVQRTTPDDDAYALLTRVQRHAPEVFRAAITEPHFGAWAARTLRQRRTGAHLRAIAAAAALRANLDFRIEVPATEVMLPGLGLCRGPIIDSTTEIAVPLRVLSAGHDVLLDDLNPYRDLPRLPASGRLTDRTALHWQSLYRSAWAALPKRRALAISSCVRTLVPLRTRGERSATSPDAFGSIALTTPRTGRELAATLVHECQHGILNAVHQLVELYDSADTSWYYSPWRTDPRPVHGLLHGAFAFLAVADFWRDRADDRAELNFTRIVLQLHRALEALESASLTEHGRRLVQNISSTVDSWGDVNPAPQALLELEYHWRTWRSRYPNLIS